SGVSANSSSASMWLPRNAGAYCSSPKLRNHASMSIPAFARSVRLSHWLSLSSAKTRHDASESGRRVLRLPLECAATPVTIPAMRFRETALATETRAERRLAAVLAADVAGYSRLMGSDEEGTHARLRAHFRELVDPKIKEHRGRIVKNTGDGLLAEFSSVVDAVRCAVDVQQGMAERHAAVAPEKRIDFRIGINLGDVIVDGDDIYGDGVSVAARLEAVAEPGGICVSRVVRDQVRDKLDYAFEDLAEQQVKNIARPVRVYALRGQDTSALSASVSPQAIAPRLSIVVLPFTNL